MEDFGELAAIVAAFIWTTTSIVVEQKGKDFTPVILNFYRMIIGLFLIIIVSFFIRRSLFHSGISLSSWLYLMLSGLIGFALGDVALFKSYQLIGARLTLLIYTFNPVITAILSFFIFRENLSGLNLAGIFLIIGGIILVITKKKNETQIVNRVSLNDLVPAFLAALGQSVGVIFSKIGMVSLDPLSATQIRLIGGLIGMILLIAFMRSWKDVIISKNNKDAYFTIGYISIVGTFIAVFLSMIAIKNAPAAIASVLMSTQPILILPISWILTKQNIKPVEFIGACMSLVGVTFLI